MVHTTNVPRHYVRIGLWLASRLPPRLAYRICSLLAAVLWRIRHRMAKVLLANLEPVTPAVPTADREVMAQHALALALRTYYETFRSVGADGRLSSSLTVAEGCPLLRRLAHADSPGPGLLVCGLHLSNFDLAGAWMARQGLEVQVLSLAEPDAGTTMINALRAQHGLLMTPIEPGALRAAIRRLRAGGIVLTGVDRPVNEGGLALPFFGRLTQMPVGHIRLALQSNAQLLVVACLEDSPGRYRLVCSEPMELLRTGDREEDITTNARMVLASVEQVIRSAPEQWLVFVPVWPPDDQPATGRNRS